MTDNKVHLGENIRAIRRIKNMKQATLARQIGITQQAVSSMERTPHIGSRRLQKIARALDVTISSIWEFKETVVLKEINPITKAILIDDIADLLLQKISKTA